MAGSSCEKLSHNNVFMIDALKMRVTDNVYLHMQLGTDVCAAVSDKMHIEDILYLILQ